MTVRESQAKTGHSTKGGSDGSSYHDRRLARRLEDPEFREEFERQQRAIKQIDEIVAKLDGLRVDHAFSKAELARRIGKNPASVRRLLTAAANPELGTVVAMADALDADVIVVPRKRRTRKSSKTVAAG